jgi:hypothetical protein
VKRKVHAERGVRHGSIPNPVPVEPDRPRTSDRIYADATPNVRGLRRASDMGANA